jgi:hypothetical protein
MCLILPQIPFPHPVNCYIQGDTVSMHTDNFASPSQLLRTEGYSEHKRGDQSTDTGK